MGDYAMKNEMFEFTYSAKQQEEIEKIRNKYLPKQESKMDQLIKLDRKAEQPGVIASIATGLIGFLLLGVGMCCTMIWNISTRVFVIGVILGIIGIMIAGFAYPIYQKVTKRERAKIADQILALSNELTC